MNREGWLTEATQALYEQFLKPQGLRFTGPVRVSCGFPCRRATSKSNGRIGECHAPTASADGTREIMIHPKLAHPLDGSHNDGYGVLPTLLHELIHACMDPGVGHKAKFAKAAVEAGLEGKPTSTYATDPEIREKLQAIADKLGKYPHASLDASGGKVQTTRLLKVMCVDCGYVNEQGNGYTTRTTRTWIEDAGLPICPCGNTMSLFEAGEEVDLVKLQPVESSATYWAPSEDGKGTDNRFQIRRTSGPTGTRWTVIDFGPDKDEDGRAILGGAAARIVAAESRQDALDMIDAVRVGLHTWDYFETGDDEVEADFEGDEWHDAPDYSDEFAEADKWEDEDETVDHPEDQEPDEWVHPISGKVVKFDYDQVAASREN